MSKIGSILKGAGKALIGMGATGEVEVQDDYEVYAKGMSKDDLAILKESEKIEKDMAKRFIIVENDRKEPKTKNYNNYQGKTTNGRQVTRKNPGREIGE